MNIRKEDLRKAARSIKPQSFTSTKSKSNSAKGRNASGPFIGIALILAVVGIGTAISNFKEVFGASKASAAVTDCIFEYISRGENSDSSAWMVKINYKDESGKLVAGLVQVFTRGQEPFKAGDQIDIYYKAGIADSFWVGSQKYTAVLYYNPYPVPIICLLLSILLAFWGRKIQKAANIEEKEERARKVLLKRARRGDLRAVEEMIKYYESPENSKMFSHSFYLYEILLKTKEEDFCSILEEQTADIIKWTLDCLKTRDRHLFKNYSMLKALK